MFSAVTIVAPVSMRVSTCSPRRLATIVRTAGKNPPARYLPPGRAWSDDDVLVAEYASGWDTLHPKTGRWAENPWVIVTRFEVVDGLATEATDAR